MLELIIEMSIAIIAIIIVLILLWKKNIKIAIVISVLILIALVVVGLFTVALKNPKMELEEKMQIEVKSSGDLEKPKTTYMFKDVTDTVKVTGEIDYNTIGSYEIKYEIPKLFGTYTRTQTIEIVDTISPEIKLEGEEKVTVTYGKEYKELGFSAIDNYDGDITDNVVVEKTKISDKELQISYTVSDSSGNTSTKIREIIYNDDTPPTITLNGGSKVTVVVGNEYKEQGAKATDKKDGDLTDKITMEGSVDTSKIGSYTITYSVTDSNGNKTTKTRTVLVTSEPVKATQGTDGQAGVIYLTFDDGPTTDITPQILDILKRKNVKATFFTINYGANKEAIVKREHDEGHTVAIHGYSHTYKEIYKSVDAYMDNLSKQREKIKATTGCDTVITRFPGGSSNTVSRFNPGIMTILTREVVSRGYKYYDWNVDSEDAGGAKTSQNVYNNVTKRLSKSKVNIVLMHDFSGNTKTLNALEDIIDYGINNGYTFSAITENTPMITHGVNN